MRANRMDWKTEREGIDLVAVATKLLGPAPGRHGERGRKLWWSCPFHADSNPSFSIEPGKPWWKCWGCGESGDAANLVMRVDGKSFPEAVAYLTDGPTPTRKPATRTEPKPPPESSGLPEADALALVEDAAARLWSPEGVEALAYLTGPQCLTAATIRAARLGWTSWVDLPKSHGGTFRALGWVIPWFVGPQLALVKIRQPDGRQPKYAEAFRSPVRLVCYPGPSTIHPGRPLIVVEGEFDALILGEALGKLAAVVTMGSASVPTTPAILSRFLTAAPWYVATDGDKAGDKAAARWPARSRRVRPPKPYKDWTEARAAGVDLSRWWRDILSGIDRPELFTWEDLKLWRWGAIDDAEPGIVFPEVTS